MSKKKNAELSRMWGFAGKRHWLTIASCILAGISTVLSIIPFVCIWFVIRDILYAMKKGDLSLAASSGHYAWFAVAFSLLSILLYFVALCCSHLAAFRTATNMKKEAMHHIVTLPLGYFSQNASGRLRKIIDDNAGLTEGFLAHQLPDLTGAVVMPVAVISLLFPMALGMEEKVAGFAGYTVVGIIILVIIFVLHYLQYTKAYIGTYEESERRRITLAEKLRTLPLGFFHERDLADLTSTIMGDCASFEHAFSHTVPQFFGALISTSIVCLVLLVMNWKMGIALLWVAPVAFAIVLLSRKWQELLAKKYMTTRIDLSEGIQECLETVQDIKACNQEKTYLEKLDAKLDAAEKAQISSEMVSASLLTTGQMVLRLGLATVIVVGSSLILKEKIDLFTYILYLIAASRLYDPLSGAMANMAELFGVNLQVKRLKEIQEYPLENGQTEYHTKGYDVIFDHVKFSYETGKTVLKDVSFTAKQGQVTALVGPSGGGKSTIAKLAAKFYDVDGGKITLGGADIAKIDPVALMKDFSIVFQDVVLFNNTIMENIRVGRKGASDEDVIAAAKAAKCHDFIEKLPQGYQTVIGENGSTLSGGECQRLSIARALLKDAPVILLDEATASLDVDSETQIQEAISELVSGKTVLVIAHRMRTIEAADQIVVLDKGVVAEKGNHDTLMKKNGLYRKLVDLQTEAANWKLSV